MAYRWTRVCRSLFLCPAKAMKISGPLAWNAKAECALRDTFGPVDFEQRVRDGSCQLWQTSTGWLITEWCFAQRMLWLWCYAGTHALELWHALADIVSTQGFTHIGCFTKHRASQWLFRKYHPRINFNGDEYSILVECAELLKYDCQGAISSTPYEKPASQSGRRESATNQRECAI